MNALSIRRWLSFSVLLVLVASAVPVHDEALGVDCNQMCNQKITIWGEVTATDCWKWQLYDGVSSYSDAKVCQDGGWSTGGVALKVCDRGGGANISRKKYTGCTDACVPLGAGWVERTTGTPTVTRMDDGLWICVDPPGS